MNRRGNEYDVSARVNTTDSAIVNSEVNQIFLQLYPRASTAQIDQAFGDLSALYRGERPGYHACDTAYHDVQHVRDLTLTHVSRGARFLRDYLPKIGMGEVADIAAALIHFTGYEIPVSEIKVPSLAYKLLGSLLGSADIIAQMSDRCYLEKCRDRLYPEFLAGGITRKRLPDGREEVLYESGEDLVRKTPHFYQSASRRLDADLGGAHKYAQDHFGGQHLYLEELTKNIDFAQTINREGDAPLKRNPPNTIPDNVP